MSKKDETLAENLSKIIEQAHELGWQSLIIADDTYSPQGIICGPREFIEDFKTLQTKLKN